MTPDNTVSKRVTTSGTIANGAANGALRNARKISNGSVSSLSNGATNGVLNGEVKNGKIKDEMGDLDKSKEGRLRSYQRAVFLALFLGYACYTYNRKSVSYATPTLLAAGLITTNTVGKKFCFFYRFNDHV